MPDTVHFSGALSIPTRGGSCRQRMSLNSSALAVASLDLVHQDNHLLGTKVLGCSQEFWLLDLLCELPQIDTQQSHRDLR